MNSTTSYWCPAVQFIGILKLSSYEENITWRKIQTMKCFILPPSYELLLHYGLLKMRCFGGEDSCCHPTAYEIV